jgi:hypothetical protein
VVIVWVCLEIGWISVYTTRARVVRRWSRRGIFVFAGVDGFGGLLPCGFLGVDVDVEPFFVFIVPDSFPA